MKTRRKNFRVPNRDIKVNLSELLFINTETFQRLNQIKQLGLAYLVYPFALHTRAAHCLDCLDMAQRFVDSLKMNVEGTLSEGEEKNEVLERLEKDTEIIRAGALLHDIMHIPFAHTFEDENKILQKGDKGKRINIMIDEIKKELHEIQLPQFDSRSVANYRIFSFSNSEEFDEAIKRCLKFLEGVRKILWTIALHDEVEEKICAEEKAGTPTNEIFEKVKKNIREKFKEELKEERIGILEAERYYISDIIGNTISADLLSYILRDPEFTGIETKPGGWYRLFDYLEIVKDNVGRNRLAIRLTKNGEWRRDAFSTIIRILNVRYDLTEQVTYHHAKLSASAMLGKAAQLCGLSESNDLYRVGDEGFFKLMENRIEGIINGKIEGCTIEDAKGAENLLQSLRCRRLHKRFHIISRRMSPQGFDLAKKYSEPGERLELEREINKLGLMPGDVIIFCPAGEGSLKEAETLVTFEKIKPNRSLETITLPLNSPECLEFLKKERGESTAMKVKNVEQQYEDLWKLYVFIDPRIIPIYGWEIKRILNEKLGPSTSFDLSYLELMEEYNLSKELSQGITQMRVPDLDRENFFAEIPTAIKQLSGRDREKVSTIWIRRNLQGILERAKEGISSSKAKQ